MAERRLRVARAQVLAFRRRTSGLDERLPHTAEALRSAAWAGLTDSMPRAALLSLHARVEDVQPTTWDEPPLAQVWGPRFSAYVVAEQDRAPFTLGRMPDAPAKQREFQRVADEIEAFLDGRRMDCREVGAGLGRHPNSLRYAAPTGRVLIRWDGARQPIIWSVPAPEVDPLGARVELARRYLHVFGPTTADAFTAWAGIRPPRGQVAFDALAEAGELLPVRTPVGEAHLLASDEEVLRAPAGQPAPARLLPSGDTSFLLWGDDRTLLVPDEQRRSELWTSRVWPGAVLVKGEVVGTWRRAGTVVTVDAWKRLPTAARKALEAEAASFPLPGVESDIQVRWAS